MAAPEERFIAAKKRYESQTVSILVDTPELAAEHGVSLGTTVMMRRVPEVIGSAQDMLDDHLYREWMRFEGWKT